MYIFNSAIPCNDIIAVQSKNLLILLLLSSVSISNQSFLGEQIRKRHGKHCLPMKRGYKCKQNKIAKKTIAKFN